MDYKRAQELLEKPLNKETVKAMKEEFAYAYEHMKKKRKRTLLTIARYLRSEHPELKVTIKYKDDVIREDTFYEGKSEGRIKGIIYGSRGGTRKYSGFELMVPHLRIHHSSTEAYASWNIDHEVYYAIGKYEHELQEE